MSACDHAIDGPLTAIARVIALDWVDGPVAGVWECGICSEAFRFDVVQQDDLDEMRVFVMRKLPTGKFGALVQLLENSFSPHWPIWVPIWSFQNPEEQAEMDAAVDAILASSEEIEWVKLANSLTSDRGYILRLLDRSDRAVVSRLIETGVSIASWREHILKNGGSSLTSRKS